METLHRKLSELDLSIRTKNILKNIGIETLQDLTTYTKSDLIKFRNFGTRSIMELEELILSNNLTFGMIHHTKSYIAQIEKLEADKAELLEMLERVSKSLDEFWKDEERDVTIFDLIDTEELESLIQKHKQ